LLLIPTVDTGIIILVLCLISIVRVPIGSGSVVKLLPRKTGCTLPTCIRLLPGVMFPHQYPAGLGMAYGAVAPSWAVAPVPAIGQARPPVAPSGAG